MQTHFSEGLFTGPWVCAPNIPVSTAFVLRSALRSIRALIRPCSQRKRGTLFRPFESKKTHLLLLSTETPCSRGK